MLKKLVPMLALMSLAFGNGLCFNPYNHDYGFIFKGLGFGLGNKKIVLHNGKMQLGKRTRIKLIKYTVNGNKALTLIEATSYAFGTDYVVVYTKCINGKPVTKNVEVVGDALGAPSAAPVQIVNLPKYPIKFGFYKNGFWIKALGITWVRHLSCNSSGCGPGGYSCDYLTEYYSSKPIPSNQEFKDHYLPTGLCQVLGKKYGP